MTSRASLLVVFGLSCIVISAFAQCTPSTCPEGPVFATFDSDDCSGEPVFESIGVEYDFCSGSQRIDKNEDGLAVFYFEDAGCNVNSTSSYRADVYPYYVCFTQDILKRDYPQLLLRSSSSKSFFNQNRATRAVDPKVMILPSVNASYTAPQPSAVFQYSPSVPLYSNSRVTCDSVGNCTLPNGKQALRYDKVYSSPTCGAEDFWEMPVAQPYECYNRFNFTYLSIHCVEEFDFAPALAHFTNPDCSGEPYFLQVDHGMCSPGNDYAAVCLARRSNPSPPTSNAANLFSHSYMVALAFVSLIASLLLF